MKFVDTKVTFAEIPDEITLCISISGCKIHCPGCHSSYLWEDIGEELTVSKLRELVENNPGITCVCFMGGNDKELFLAYINVLQECRLKSAWYTGLSSYPEWAQCFDYVKFGPYIVEKGPITERTTNQRMIQFNHPEPGIIAPSWFLKDITYKFWGDEENLETIK